MDINEWKVKLIPAGLLLACYFAAPLLVQWALGEGYALAGGFTAADLLQAGLGAAILYWLFGQKELLAQELRAWLGGKGQPPANTLLLTAKIASSAGYVSAAALLLPPLGGMFPRSFLLTLAKLCAIIYFVRAAYVIWGLLDPFLAYVPPAEESAAARGEQPAAAGRCPKCGQQLDASMKVCAFCKHPLTGPR